MHKRRYELIYPAAALLQDSPEGEAAGAHSGGVDGSGREAVHCRDGALTAARLLCQM